MADTKLTALTAQAGAVVAADLFYGVDDPAGTPASVKVTGTQLKTFTSLSPTLVTPDVGVAIGTSLALGGATIGSNALAVTGTSLLTGTSTITGGTVTASTPVISATQTWNNAAVAFTGFLFNATDTASDAASNFVDYQIAGSSRFRVQKDGDVFINAASGSSPTFFTKITTDTASRTSLGLDANNDPVLGFGAGGGSGRDVFLTRDAANTLAQRNGTNSQTFRLYQTESASLTNYVRFDMGFSGGRAFIVTNAAGTGTGHVATFGTNTANDVTLRTNTTDRWSIGGSTGHLLAVADNTYDIGASGATRPRTIYVGTSLIVPTVTLSPNNPLTLNTSDNRIVGTTTAILDFVVNGSTQMRVNGSTYLGVTAALGLGGASSPDAFISRNAAGVMQIGTSSSNASGSILALAHNHTATTVGALGAATTAGQRKFVTDALTPVFGSTVVAGGAVNVPVYSDGSNWIVG